MRNPVELKENEYLKDTTPFSLKMARFLQGPQSYVLFFVFSFCALILPGLGLLFLVLSLFSFLVFISRTFTLPMHIPFYSKLKRDSHDIDAETGKPNKPAGALFLGNTEKGNQEIWQNKTSQTEHAAHLATTGGGKTVSQTSQLLSSFIEGSGALYTDGKAQLDVPMRIIALAHRVGRGHDCLITNFLTGDESPWEKNKIKNSHSFSFLYSGSASMVSETLMGLLKVDDDMWGQRARMFLRAVGFMVVYLRDIGQINPTFKVLLDFMDLQYAMKWASDKRIPETAKGLLNAYIDNLPQLNEQDKQTAIATGQINAKVAEQHGYISMQLVPLLGTMQYEYEDIMSPATPEIDLFDVVVHNRILVNLLPALEKSSESVLSLGRILVSAVKSMMAGAMFTTLDGKIEEKLSRLPTNTDVAFPVKWDEIGYYFSEMQSVVAAQARSLNFSLLYGAQDVAAMKKEGEKVAKATEAVLANTNTWLIGKTVDANETLEIVKKRAAEGTYAEKSNADKNEGVMGGYTSKSVSYTRRDRLNIKKLSELRAGQAYIIWKSNIIKANLFYAQVPSVKVNRLAEFIPLPSIESIKVRLQIDDGIEEAFSVLADPQAIMPSLTLSEEIRRICAGTKDGKWSSINNIVKGEAQRKAEERKQREIQDIDNIERTFNGFDEPIALGSEDILPPEYLEQDTDDEDQSGDSDGGGRVAKPLEEKPIDEHKKTYKPLFETMFDYIGQSEESLIQALQGIETQQGVNSSQANQNAKESIEKIKTSFEYPKTPTPSADAEGFTQILEDVIDMMDDPS